MRHLTEEDLVLHHYGEDDVRERADARAHLDACERCQADYTVLQRTLAAVDASEAPARGDGYEREVWARLEPRLAASRPSRWWDIFTVRRLVLAGSVAALVVAAFVAGRFWPRQEGPAPVQEASHQQVRERILLVAVGDHLDRSQMVLIELMNAEPGAQMDISAEQQRARDLVDANRLYRQTAATAGDATVASVLDDLERVLLEITHSPSSLSSSEFEEIRQRIEAQGIVFKIRVLGTRVRERETASARSASTRS